AQAHAAVLMPLATWLGQTGNQNVIYSTSGMVPERLVAQFIADEGLDREQANDVHRALQEITIFMRPTTNQSEPARPPVASEISDAALETAISRRDVRALHLIHANVENAQWRNYADAVLEHLSLLPPLPPPPPLLASYIEAAPEPEPETSQRSDIMAAVADALFEEEAGTVLLDGRSPIQQGHLMAALAYATLTGLVLDLEPQRFAPLIARLRGLDDATP
ncbi:hypothetical protein ACC754_36850, partial [Rhizobium johnstonii]|uniref:hypothetical protein n=1 Tax=Rhizobium johnstonii TaxID=3019933 RepID=UPI003F95D228